VVQIVVKLDELCDSEACSHGARRTTKRAKVLLDETQSRRPAHVEEGGPTHPQSARSMAAERCPGARASMGAFQHVQHLRADDLSKMHFLTLNLPAARSLLRA